jgi:hypothetical protein
MRSKNLNVCSYLVQDSSKLAMELAKKGPKLGAFTVRLESLEVRGSNSSRFFRCLVSRSYLHDQKHFCQDLVYTGLLALSISDEPRYFEKITWKWKLIHMHSNLNIKEIQFVMSKQPIRKSPWKRMVCGRSIVAYAQGLRGWARRSGLEVRRAEFPEGGPAFEPPNRGTLSYPPTSNFPST